MYEGVAKVLMNSIKAAFMKNTLSKISYLGVKSGINDMKSSLIIKNTAAQSFSESKSLL